MNEGLLVQDANLMFFSKMKKLKKKKIAGGCFRQSRVKNVPGHPTRVGDI